MDNNRLKNIISESIRKVVKEEMQQGVQGESNYQKFINFLASLNTDVYYPDYVEERYFDEDYTVDDLFDAIDNSDGFTQEIIYYSNAMNYLMRNDPSLQRSLEKAQELGYSLDNLNSETLATLLTYDENIKEWYKVKDKIEQFLDELVWPTEDEDEDEE